MSKILRSILAVVIVAASLLCTISTIRSFATSDSSSLRASAGAASHTVPTRQELGRSTWTLLHRAAAKYDEEPTTTQQQQMHTFIRTLGDLYPCDECASHFREMLQRTPPQVGSSATLSRWLCERHNEVNVRLGKQVFSCNAEHLKERWGDCGCSEAAPSDKKSA